MTFLEDIKKQTVEASNPITRISNNRAKLIELFKSCMESSACKGESEAFVWRESMQVILGFDPSRLYLKNAFNFLQQEKIDYEYRWDNYSVDFVLHIKW